mmetsp:Transcript_2496/g.6212  ORF Transcript_2496/g.6212 Transcript_2496/m.6212 type:complete len:338 (-) Transcript_2496:251-1264(-)
MSDPTRRHSQLVSGDVELADVVDDAETERVVVGHAERRGGRDRAVAAAVVGGGEEEGRSEGSGDVYGYVPVARVPAAAAAAVADALVVVVLLVVVLVHREADGRIIQLGIAVAPRVPAREVNDRGPISRREDAGGAGGGILSRRRSPARRAPVPERYQVDSLRSQSDLLPGMDGPVLRLLRSVHHETDELAVAESHEEHVDAVPRRCRGRRIPVHDGIIVSACTGLSRVHGYQAQAPRHHVLSAIIRAHPIVGIGIVVVHGEPRIGVAVAVAATASQVDAQDLFQRRRRIEVQQPYGEIVPKSHRDQFAPRRRRRPTRRAVHLHEIAAISIVRRRCR